MSKNTKKESNKVIKNQLFLSKEKLPIELEQEKKDRETKKFRIRSKRFFLTYPKVPELEKSELEKTFINCLKESFGVKSSDNWGYVLSVEEHADGTPHLHVYLEFSSPQGVYSRNKLHVPVILKDGTTKICEGRYEAVKNHHHVIQYVLKTVDNFGEVSTNMVLPIFSGTYYSDPNEHLHAVVREVGLKEAIQVFMEQYPAMAVSKGRNVLRNLEAVSRYFAESKYASAVEVKDIDSFVNIPQAVEEWRDSRGARSLVLHGPSGTGKTELAKSLLVDMGMDYALIRELNSLRDFDLVGYMGLIFDDIRMVDRDREQLIHLFDVENNSQIRVLYGTCTIPAGFTRVFTTNRVHEFRTHDEAINRRLCLVEIDKPLFLDSTATSGATDLSSTDEGKTVLGEVLDVKVKRKRGRPKGSKNKTKKVDSTGTVYTN